MRPATSRLTRLGALAALGGAGYGLLEAALVVRRDVEVPHHAIPAALDGLRIAHLSDFHLGAPGIATIAVRRAVDLVVAARPDLVCVTGDLRSHPRGDAELRRALARLAVAAPTFAVRGNHDVGEARDPFAGPEPLGSLDDTGAVVLDDAVAQLTLRGVTVAVGGIHPSRWRTSGGLERVVGGLADAPFRLLLSHFPEALDLVAGRVHLVLAGHMHGGQLALPSPTGRLPLSCPGSPYPDGTFGRDGTILHVTRGVGTTFVPFRVLARPDVTVLRLRPI